MQPIRLAPGDFLGGITRALDAADLKLRETSHARRQKIPPHTHEAPHFCVGLDGHCTERIRGRRVDCGPGTLEFHPAGTEHSSQWGDRGGRCFTVTLGARWIERIDSLDRADRPFGGVLSADTRPLVRRLHRELLDPDAASPLVLEGLTLALMGEATSRGEPATGGAPPAWLARAEEYLRECAFGPVRAEEAARLAGVHPVVLARWFRRTHGVTVGEFVRRLRVDRAADLLTRTTLPLSRIAQECGFADHSHFTRTFRRERHQSPSEYRRRRL
jgi:AraC family transcriptional regulator